MQVQLLGLNPREWPRWNGTQLLFDSTRSQFQLEESLRTLLRVPFHRTAACETLLNSRAKSFSLVWLLRPMLHAPSLETLLSGLQNQNGICLFSEFSRPQKTFVAPSLELKCPVCSLKSLSRIQRLKSTAGYREKRAPSALPSSGLPRSLLGDDPPKRRR